MKSKTASCQFLATGTAAKNGPSHYAHGMRNEMYLSSEVALVRQEHRGSMYTPFSRVVYILPPPNSTIQLSTDQHLYHHGGEVFTANAAVGFIYDY